MTINRYSYLRITLLVAIVWSTSVLGDALKIELGVSKSLAAIPMFIAFILTIGKLKGKINPIELTFFAALIVVETIISAPNGLYVFKLVLVISLALQIRDDSKNFKLFEAILYLNYVGLVLLAIVLVAPQTVIFENNYLFEMRKSSEGYGQLYFGKNYSGLILIGDEKKTIFGFSISRFSGYYFEPAVMCYIMLLSATTLPYERFKFHLLPLLISIILSFSVMGFLGLTLLLTFRIGQVRSKILKSVFQICALGLALFALGDLSNLVLEKLNSSSGAKSLFILSNLFEMSLVSTCSYNASVVACDGPPNIISGLFWWMLISFVLLMMAVVLVKNLTGNFENSLKEITPGILIFCMFLIKSPYFVVFSLFTALYVVLLFKRRVMLS